MTRLRVAAALAALLLAGCMQTASDVTSRDHPSASDVVNGVDLQPRFPRATANADTGGPAPAPVSYYATQANSGVEAAAAPSAAAAADPAGEFSLNFENTPTASVAQSVLGDILHVGYVVDPRAQGSISLSSGRPIAKKDILFVLENALRANNLALLRDPSGYRIAPATDGMVGSVDRPAANGDVEPGYGLTVIPVQYVSAATLTKLMEGFAAKPGMVRSDPSGRLLLVVGSGPERQAAVDTVRNFDVDWLRGQSVGFFPVHNSAPDPVVAELEKIMDSGESGLGHNLVKFQTVERQNSIMVVAAKPELLRTAAMWISRLDTSAVASTGVKVYRVKFGDAKKIADLLSKIFDSGGSSSADSAASQVAPSSGTTSLSVVDRLTGGAKTDASNASAHAASDASQSQGASAGSGASTSPYGALAAKFASASGAGALSGVRITPDVANNSILIYANEENYRVIERALAQLDRPKLQVAIDVTIAEVTLNDELNYGVQFFIENKYGSIGNSTGSSTTISPTVPGFNFTIGSAASPRVILSALHQYTDVKVLSNPSLVVVNNETATLEVGDQVPVSTGTATVLSSSDTVVSTIDYKNTGIILHVQPRVNSNGTVLLDVEQEISSVTDSTTSTTSSSSSSSLTPTISERKVKSELSVADNQTVLLAGMISETQNITHSGVPVLDQIPLVGNAFSTKGKTNSRTELIIFIKPQIIHDGADASVVAEQLRSKMRGGQLGSLGLPNLFAPDTKRTLQ